MNKLRSLFGCLATVFALYGCESPSLPVKVTGIEVNPSELSLVEGETSRVTATVKPVDAENKSFSWSSDNSQTVTVSSDGTVTAIKEGTANITATTEDGGLKASCIVRVASAFVHVTSVTLDKTSVDLVEGNSEILVATVLPENASNNNISWSSDNEDVVSVDQNGRIEARAAGTAIIIATTEDGGKTASCKVTVSERVYPVSDVTVDPTSLSMKVGETKPLCATISPANATDKTVTWRSSNESIAKVSPEGEVTAVSIGATTITVTTTDGGKTATCAITVAATPVTSVSLDKTSASLKAGETVTLTATVKPDDATDKTVTWTTSDATVATVSNGVVTAKKIGTATITAKAGENVTLTATVSPDNATDKTVTWTTSDATVATVSNGVVTAKKVGTATITAKAGEKTATCAITVIPTPVTGITLSETALELFVEDQVTLTATVSPSDATDKSYTWSSDNVNVATVSSTGVVTAKGAGTANITVTTTDGGKTATCSVVVHPKGAGGGTEGGGFD